MIVNHISDWILKIKQEHVFWGKRMAEGGGRNNRRRGQTSKSSSARKVLLLGLRDTDCQRAGPRCPRVAVKPPSQKGIFCKSKSRRPTERMLRVLPERCPDAWKPGLLQQWASLQCLACPEEPPLELCKQK